MMGLRLFAFYRPQSPRNSTKAFCNRGMHLACLETSPGRKGKAARKVYQNHDTPYVRNLKKKSHFSKASLTTQLGAVQVGVVGGAVRMALAATVRNSRYYRWPVGRQNSNEARRSCIKAFSAWSLDAGAVGMLGIVVYKF